MKRMKRNTYWNETYETTPQSAMVCLKQQCVVCGVIFRCMWLCNSKWYRPTCTHCAHATNRNEKTHETIRNESKAKMKRMKWIDGWNDGHETIILETKRMIPELVFQSSNACLTRHSFRTTTSTPSFRAMSAARRTKSWPAMSCMKQWCTTRGFCVLC